MINYLARNAKMIKSGPKIFNWGIPAFRAKDGFVTCPGAAQCAAGCYARPGQGFYGYDHVSKAYHRRLDLSFKPEFVDTIDAEIKRKKARVIRVHDSGDFYSKKYVTDWQEIAKRNPETKFYSYTKNIPLVREFFWPENWTMIYSEGGKYDDQINRRWERHARVFINERDIEAAGYANATHDDMVAAFGPNHKIGLAYHGTWKNKAFQTGPQK